MVDTKDRVIALIKLKEYQEKLEQDSGEDKIKEKLQTLRKIDELLKADDLRAYAKLTAKEINEKLKLQLEMSSESPAPAYSGQDSVLNTIMEEYKKKFLSNNSYKPGYSEPSLLDGKLSLKFPTEAEELEFDLEMAAKGLKFNIIDVRTKCVIAHSENGVLYHGARGDINRKVFHRGESYYNTPSQVTQLEAKKDNSSSPSTKR